MVPRLPDRPGKRSREAEMIICRCRCTAQTREQDRFLSKLDFPSCGQGNSGTPRKTEMTQAIPPGRIDSVRCSPNAKPKEEEQGGGEETRGIFLLTSTYAAEDRVRAEIKNIEPVEEQHTPGTDSDSESNSLLRASIPTQEHGYPDSRTSLRSANPANRL